MKNKRNSSVASDACAEAPVGDVEVARSTRSGPATRREFVSVLGILGGVGLATLSEQARGATLNPLNPNQRRARAAQIRRIRPKTIGLLRPALAHSQPMATKRRWPIASETIRKVYHTTRMVKWRRRHTTR
jgi:hypothetical protein